MKRECREALPEIKDEFAQMERELAQETADDPEAAAYLAQQRQMLAQARSGFQDAEKRMADEEASSE